jgi:HSP20 family protein
MPLRPDPLQELLELQERMNRLFDETLSRDRLDEPQVLHGSWVPVADVVERADAYVIELELPGLDRQEVTVQAQGAELIVRGQRGPSAGGRPEAFHRLERRHGPFARSFRFPGGIEVSAISAELNEGVLRLTVPKPHASPARRVRVERRP